MAFSRSAVLVAALGGTLLAVPAQPAAAAVAGTPVTYAGDGYGDGGLATSARILPATRHVAVDADGNVYVPDPHAHTVRKIDAETGLIERVAGTGEYGSSGDGGPATEARLEEPVAVTLAPDGALLVADRQAGRIRRVAPDGTISTLAGNGSKAISQVPVPAATAAVYPTNLYVAPDGTIYVTEPDTVRKIVDGTISRVAGQAGFSGSTGDGGPAVDAYLAHPADVLAHDGYLYVADGGNNRVRRIDANGVITTVAGAGNAHSGGEPGNGGPATAAYFAGLNALGVRASDGAILAADTRSGVRAFVPGGTIDVAAALPCPGIVEPEPAGTFLVSCDYEIRRVAADGESDELVAGTRDGAVGDGLPATEAALNGVRGLAADAAGNLYIPERWGGRVRKVDAGGVISTVAGTVGLAGASSGDGGPATEAVLRSPGEVAVAPDGTLYVADTVEHTVRKVATDGTITTLPTGPLTGPLTLAATNAGVDVADQGGLRVLHVAGDGTVTTVAGGGSVQGRAAEGGPATGVGIAPRSVARTAGGALLVVSGDFLYRVADGVVAEVTRVGSAVARVAVDFAGNVVLQQFTTLHVHRANGSVDAITVPIVGIGLPGWAVLPDGRVAFTEDWWQDRNRVRVTTPAAAAPPAPVTGLRVQSAPPVAFWNALPAGVHAVPVLRRGAVAPRTPFDGIDLRYYGDGANGGTHLPSDEDGNIVYGETYTLAVFAYSSATNTYSAPAVATFQPRIPPPPVTALTFKPGIGNAIVRWKNPASGFTEVVVRMAAGTTPPTATSGTRIYRGTGTGVVKSGLALGTTYSFSVFTRNAAGDHSAPLSGTLYGTKLTIKRSATTVAYQGRVTISGTVTRGGVMTAPDEAVQLLARRLGTSTWVSIGYYEVSARDTYSFAHRPSYSTEYQIRYPGTGQRLGTYTKAVVKVRTRVTATASRSSVPLGGGVTIRGSVAPSHAGKQVTVQRYVAGEWRTVGYATLSATSTYAYAVTPPARGRYYYRVVKRADTDHAESVSPTVRFDVT